MLVIRRRAGTRAPFEYSTGLQAQNKGSRGQNKGVEDDGASRFVSKFELSATIYLGRSLGRKVPMALSIKSPEVERKVRKLAAATGQSITMVVSLAVDEQLKREDRKRENKEHLIEELMAIAHHCASLPVLDDRS